MRVADFVGQAEVDLPHLSRMLPQLPDGHRDGIGSGPRGFGRLAPASLSDGWSKTYAMTGWRLGYSVWPAPLYDAARKLAVNSYSCVNAPTQFAGLAALTGPQDAVGKMVAEFDARRRVVVEGLNALPKVRAATPKGAFYAFPNISATGWKAKPLANALLEKAGVATIGGPDFGVYGEGFLRLSYANSTENIVAALQRIRDFLSNEKPPAL